MTDGGRASAPAITLPTWLTLSRFALAPLAALLILQGAVHFAAAILIITAVTDYADGALARRLGTTSAIGAALDPVADKVVALFALLALCLAGVVTSVHLIPLFVILFREILISGLRESLRKASDADGETLAVTWLAKVKTAVQFVTLVLLCAFPSALALGCLWLAAGLTAWTGASYVRQWWATISS